MGSRVLYIGHSWPEPDTTAAGLRQLSLIRAFRKNGYEVHFGCAAGQTQHSIDPADLDFDSHRLFLNDARSDALIKDISPTIVVFDRFMTEEQFGWRVARAVPGSMRLLDTQDLHSLRLVRSQNPEAGESSLVSQWCRHPTFLRELASIYRSDLSLIISSSEINMLNSLTPIAPGMLHYLPLTVAQNDNLTINNYEERFGFICIGNGKHQPNTDAVTFLKQTIWPSIRKQLPKSELRVFGAYLPQYILDFHNPGEGFLVKGWAEDAVAEMGKARVQLAPLRFGAGLKGKLLMGMACGTPSVTTPIGAEGLAEGSWGGVIAEAGTAIAEAASQLYTDAELWNAASIKGLELLSNFKEDPHYDKLFQRIEMLITDLEQHREKNLIGSMLRHHTMASTEYMGRWIESKNKGRDC